MGVSRGESKTFQAITLYIVWILKPLDIVPLQKVNFFLLFHLVIKDYFSDLYLSYFTVTIYVHRTFTLILFCTKTINITCSVSFSMFSFNLKWLSSKEFWTFFIVVCPSKCLLNEWMTHGPLILGFLSMPIPPEQWLQTFSAGWISLSPCNKASPQDELSHRLPTTHLPCQEMLMKHDA